MIRGSVRTHRGMPVSPVEPVAGHLFSAQGDEPVRAHSFVWRVLEARIPQQVIHSIDDLPQRTMHPRRGYCADGDSVTSLCKKINQ